MDGMIFRLPEKELNGFILGHFEKLPLISFSLVKAGLRRFKNRFSKCSLDC